MNRFCNVPLALRSDCADIILELLLHEGGKEAAAFESEGNQPAEPAYTIVEGIAIVPVRGVLLHGGGCWFGTGYDDIDGMITAAMDDPQVRAVAMHIDSPGGEVAGCFDLCDRIYAMRGIKPMWSILDEGAYSAAYAVASCADMVCVPRTGGTGSIGVIAMHIDISAALEQYGYKVSLIQYGDRKTELYPMVPLSQAARKRLQADVDAMGGMFVDIITRNRGIDRQAVIDTQAGLFLGSDGVDAGLADAAMSCGDAFNALLAALT